VWGTTPLLSRCCAPLRAASIYKTHFLSVSLRVTFSPFHSESTILHLSSHCVPSPRSAHHSLRSPTLRAGPVAYASHNSMGLLPSILFTKHNWFNCQNVHLHICLSRNHLLVRLRLSLHHILFLFLFLSLYPDAPPRVDIVLHQRTPLPAVHLPVPHRRPDLLIHRK
jgi:hypothetical protein